MIDEMNEAIALPFIFLLPSSNVSVIIILLATI
jgi:hypothetical protein